MAGWITNKQTNGIASDLSYLSASFLLPFPSFSPLDITNIQPLHLFHPLRPFAYNPPPRNPQSLCVVSIPYRETRASGYNITLLCSACTSTGARYSLPNHRTLQHITVHQPTSEGAKIPPQSHGIIIPVPLECVSLTNPRRSGPNSPIVLFCPRRIIHSMKK